MDKGDCFCGALRMVRRVTHLSSGVFRPQVNRCFQLAVTAMNLYIHNRELVVFSSFLIWDHNMLDKGRGWPIETSQETSLCAGKSKKVGENCYYPPHLILIPTVLIVLSTQTSLKGKKEIKAN